ncbi:MAG: class I SAM-dependent methyltransferase [Bryobacterales bacterium]|nr:class I SAM-dependent methyltransferase [Bryobacterales bacterium]
MRQVPLSQILEQQQILHGAGSLSRQALEAIARRADGRAIRHSAETGCGASTLLLSHLSENHAVFSLDVAASMTNIRQSPLLRSGVVTFVEGPTQRTLPRHEFSQKLQLVLLDGPHAYPFPDLEYYYLYPHLETGALLILDDIQIPTIHHLFDFLRHDRMFHLDEVVRNTAFFTRTAEYTFDPLGDGWQAQRYNERALPRYDWRKRLGMQLQRPLVRELLGGLWKLRERAAWNASVRILSPAKSQGVAAAGTVMGRVELPPDSFLWVLVHRVDVAGWWPQGGGPAAVASGDWEVSVKFGEHSDAGHDFDIAALVVGPSIHRLWLQWVNTVSRTNEAPPVQAPAVRFVFAESRRRVHRGA